MYTWHAENTCYVVIIFYTKKDGGWITYSGYGCFTLIHLNFKVLSSKRVVCFSCFMCKRFWGWLQGRYTPIKLGVHCFATEVVFDYIDDIILNCKTFGIHDISNNFLKIKKFHELVRTDNFNYFRFAPVTLSS